MNATGSVTAGLGFGGNNPSPTASRTDTEKFNGTAWTEANNMNTARDENSLSSRGSPQSSVISVFGTATETYNGTNWTETTEVNTSRKNGAGAGESSTSAVIYGGGPNLANTEEWDGTSWTEGNDLSTGRQAGGTTGATAQNALYAGGEPPSYQSATEEWAYTGIPPATTAVGYADAIVGDMYYNSVSGQFKAIKNGGAPIGSWASAPSLNTARYEIVGVGIQTAALGVGGTENPGTRTDLNEEFDGSAWSEKSDLNTGRTAMGSAERGTTTSTLVFGGATTGGESALSESWNGSSWTATNTLNTAAYRCAGAGTLTAALRIGGNIPPATTNTEKFDGTNWTEVNELNTARQFMAGGGTQTSAVIGGGTIPPGTIYSQCEVFNGTSWTEKSELNTGRYDLGGNAADSTDALIYGGVLPPGGPPNYVANCEYWDGTSWTEVSDLSGVRGSGGGAGASSSSALTMGGQNPGPALTTAEIWTAADFDIKTVTTS